MTAGWVAGSVRARGLAWRRLGADEARRLATCRSLAEALRMLAAGPYADAGQPGHSLAQAQATVRRMLLWDMRVLAGWLPRTGVDLLRTLACWFEIANVDELLCSFAGRPAEPEFRLGALATAWPRLRGARSADALRAALTASPWRDPGGDGARAIRLGMRARWAARVAEARDPARSWAAAAVALLLAGELAADLGDARPLRRPAAELLGPAAAGAVTLSQLRDGLPARVRWVLAGVEAPGDLWRAEANWWARLDRDGQALLRSSGAGPDVALGAVAVMAADARRVLAALELAARGGGPLEAYDAVA